MIGIIICVVIIVIAVICISTSEERSESAPPPQIVVIREPARRDPHKYINKRNHRYDERNERHRKNRETFY